MSIRKNYVAVIAALVSIALVWAAFSQAPTASTSSPKAVTNNTIGREAGPSSTVTRSDTSTPQNSSAQPRRPPPSAHLTVAALSHEVEAAVLSRGSGRPRVIDDANSAIRRVDRELEKAGIAAADESSRSSSAAADKLADLQARLDRLNQRSR